ncbi:hypothetical protein [Leptospira santarosai]|uniref:hypothetical protein n=1 Tax=Leptospira santarosai TaxID=28183 RepID=UPI0024AF5E61|nr:hypothetical protein [Leptospira santarosai]MDI7213797.1 hypothetical protein [Leptospira santarosai]
MKAVDKNITELFIARHAILKSFISTGITDMKDIVKVLIDSSACTMVFLRKHNLLEDHEEFINELKIEAISLGKKNEEKER